MPRSSVATPASTASHRNVRDDREPPLIRAETRGVKSLICPTAKAECFFREGWTDFGLICPSGRRVAAKHRNRRCAQSEAGRSESREPVSKAQPNTLYVGFRR